jgi:hypothetical protein
METRRMGLVLLGLVVSLVCAGCPGALEDPARFVDAAADAADVAERGDAGCPDVPTAVFAARCATAGCHSAADKAQGLDLQSPNLGARLAGACAKGGGYLIDTSNPGASVIYTKVLPTPPFGARMPTGGQPLDDATLACILAWVRDQQGAPESCGTGGPVGDAGADG